VVLGLTFLTNTVEFELTLTIRYRGELVLGLALIGLASFPRGIQTSIADVGFDNDQGPPVAARIRRDRDSSRPGADGSPVFNRACHAFCA
jgi:hypothetical protein